VPRTPADTPHYGLFPRVVPEGWSGKLRVMGEYAHTKLKKGVKYEYSLASMRWRTDSARRREPLTGVVKADARGGVTIPFAPDMIGEWTLTVTSEDKSVRVLPELGLYVIERSLRKLRPYIGDLHTHSTGSDGRQEPAYCGIRSRELGYDFLALTDHNNFHSSGEMIRKVRSKLGSTMLLMRGEELHAAPRPFHHVGIGQSRSIDDIRNGNKRRYRSEVRRIMKELAQRELVRGLDVEAYAEALWKIRKTKELGGLVLFAHPYWSYRNTLCVDEADREQTFIDREFDAVEVTTSADPSFVMANRLEHETAARGPMSVVGISDAHSWLPGDAAGVCCTYVLAEDLTQEAVFAAIRAGRSLACERIDGRLRLAGPFELTDFANFYLSKLLPVRRRLMEIEAQLAFSALRGGSYSRDMVEKLDKELARLDRKMWA